MVPANVEKIKLHQIARQEPDAIIFDVSGLPSLAQSPEVFLIFYLAKEDEQNGYGTIIQLDEATRQAAIYADLNPEYTYLFYQNSQGELQSLLWCIEVATRTADGLFIAHAKSYGRGISQEDLARVSQAEQRPPAAEHSLAETYTPQPAAAQPAPESPPQPAQAQQPTIATAPQAEVNSNAPTQPAAMPSPAPAPPQAQPQQPQPQQQTAQPQAQPNQPLSFVNEPDYAELENDLNLPPLPASAQPATPPTAQPASPATSEDVLSPIPDILAPAQSEFSQQPATPAPAPTQGTSSSRPPRPKQGVGRPPKPLMQDKLWPVSPEDFSWLKSVSRQPIAEYKELLRQKTVQQIRTNRPGLMEDWQFNGAFDQAFNALCITYELVPAIRHDIIKSLLNGRVVESVYTRMTQQGNPYTGM